MYSDRTGGNVKQSVLHGVVNSFVEVEEYKKKAQLKVRQQNNIEVVSKWTHFDWI